MRSWLSSLPHQIPFRAASVVRKREESAIEGEFLWTANETLPPELMLIEAMAQFAGGLALESQGFLTGIDHCEVRRAIEAGDRVTIRVTLETSFGRIFRFSGTAAVNGVEIGNGRFYLAASDEAS